MLLALLLGLTAAAANILGGLFILHREWSRQYLKYFLALGAGFMLAAAILEILPESVALTGSLAYFLVLVGYFIVHFFEHTLAPHFHFGEETHVEHFVPNHAGISALLGLSIHTFFDGVAIASGFLVSGWLGGVIFLAIVLHKIPEGFTVASLMLASGQSRRTAFLAAIWLGVATVAGWGSGAGGYGEGAIEYAGLTMIEGQTSDADIAAAVASVLPVTAIAWLRISN